MHHPIEVEPDERDLRRAAEFLSAAQRVAVLTGAGVSAESGVPTFRGAGGLWEGHRVEDVATPEAFAANPDLVWRFYNLRRAKLWTVSPNPGHQALARMEQRWGSDRFTVCTQNIDGLHRAAGSRHVLELHGNLARVRCTVCPFTEERPNQDLPPLPECPTCGALLRPDIVWFHEMLPNDVWHEAAESALTCDVFVVAGTSAVVYPAARLVHLAQTTGARVIEVNLEPSAVSHGVDVHLQGKSGQVLPRLEELL
jgi:NAD-dependent protein deacetylase/lipoamidase